MTILSGWGRFPRIDTETIVARSLAAGAASMAASQGIVARGNGRAYGDAAIGSRTTLLMRELDRFRSFDPSTGLLTVEAGALLSDIIAAFLPIGFFPKVVPGTRFVTVGGAIASDVHGKNHHRDGGFGNCVASLVLATGGGEVLHVSSSDNPDVFLATIGGMGLTGTILEATLRLSSVETGWIRQETMVAPDLAATIDLLEANENSTYSVAWLDCVATGHRLGRAIVFLGEHARRDDLEERGIATHFPSIKPPRFSVPFDLPGFALSRFGVLAFNELYYRANARKAGTSTLVSIEPYFFPLDGIGEWNRIYGRRGFVQHQSVVPTGTAKSALAEMLEYTSRRSDGAFLAVLKKLGPSAGLMSFPLSGYTLTLDLPVRSDLLEFLEKLDAIVVKAGGRLYLAKDARQSRATFAAGYPALSRFQQLRRRLDPHGRICSQLSARLDI